MRMRRTRSRDHDAAVDGVADTVVAADGQPPSPEGDGAPVEGTRALVARQSICDHRGVTRAFELLFRDPLGRPVDAVGGTAATASAIVAALADIGLREVTGGHPAWINVTRELLTTELVDVLPPESTVIEILEDQIVDDELIAAVERLVRRGATVALDDFQYTPDADPLLRLATWVKIDIRAVGTLGFAEHADILRPFGVHLLAEKVETLEELDACRAAGASLFQGYVFSRPRTIEKRAIPAGNASRLELIRRVNDPDVDFEELQRIVTQDVALSYRFMRYVNSAYIGIPREITSIKEALVIMGLEKVRRWTTVLAAAAVTPSQPDLLGTALIRAHMCATLASRQGADTNAAYTVGLLSVIDVLLDQPMHSILEQLPLSPEVNEALGRQEGALGAALSTVIDYEQGVVADPLLGAAFAAGVRDAAEALVSL